MKKKSKLIKLFLSMLLITSTFYPYVQILPISYADEVVPPTYQWIKESNPWYELTEEQRLEIVPHHPDIYIIESAKLVIYYPTQNIDVEFLCRKIVNIPSWEPSESNNYYIQQDLALSISYYDKGGSQLWSGIYIGGGQFRGYHWGDEDTQQQQHSNSYTDVYFINSGRTLCWNMTSTYWNTAEDFIQKPVAINYTVDYVVKIDNYKNDTLFFEIDTTIHFNKTHSVDRLINLTMSYGCDLFDILKFQMVYPENMTTGAFSGWYKIGDYDVMTILTAEQGRFIYDNGTDIWKNLSRGMIIEETPPELNPDIKPYGIIYNIYMNNLPVNDTKGNISTIYYDPLVIGFYEARVNFILEICIIPIGVGIMVYFISYKKKQAIKSVKEE
ncbi:MAG: hypothetical protein ACTSWR_00205 [Candidatus Helarchaeota archaeon]